MANGRGDLWERVIDDLGCELEVVERAAEAKGFVVQQLRGIIEQSIACPGDRRRRVSGTRFASLRHVAHLVLQRDAITLMGVRMGVSGVAVERGGASNVRGMVADVAGCSARSARRRRRRRSAGY